MWYIPSEQRRGIENPIPDNAPPQEEDDGEDLLSVLNYACLQHIKIIYPQKSTQSSIVNHMQLIP